MSNHTDPNLQFDPYRHTQLHVGGKHKPSDNKSYLDNQANLIKRQDFFLPPSVRSNRNRWESRSDVRKTVRQNTETEYRDGDYADINRNTSAFNVGVPFTRPLKNNIPYETGKQRVDNIYYRKEYDRYDPYEGFLYKKGLIDDGTNRRRYKTFYKNIDSRFRDREPSAEVEDCFVLNDNPLTFGLNSKTLFINHDGHDFEIGDLVTIENVVGKQMVLRTFNDAGEPSFDIPTGCNVMKVFAQHDLPLSYTDSTVEVELQGVKGDRGSVSTSSFLGSIPINTINTRHAIRINIDPTELDCTLPDGFLTPSPDHFFVILNANMTTDYLLKSYNYKVIFHATKGIPTNLINARYPIDREHRRGYQVIKSVRDNGYEIELPFQTNFRQGTGNFAGGNCVTVCRVVSIRTGFPNANIYDIDLEEVYHDVVSARLVSIEFPNSANAIRDFPMERANNKIYWNDVDDGDFEYCIEIPPGNYSPTDLTSKMEELFLAVPRVNAGIGNSYEPSHNMRVTINQNTNEMCFESFKEFRLTRPIIDVDPEIAPDAAVADPVAEANATYTLTINHPGHGFTSAGSTITIQNAIAHLGIPASVINMTHTVSEIVDENTYKIVLPQGTFNLSSTRIDTGGGAAVTILVPDAFRLLFDRDDTMGALLGFRNPGNVNSVFPFQTKISNNDMYEFDVTMNAFGEESQLNNNAVQLSGDDYVLMIARPLETLYSLGPTKKAFAKILLCDIPGKVLFSTHVGTSRFYEDPIHELSRLSIEYRTPDGFLYDFNGLEHSFTMEIVTVTDIPRGTGIDANTGRNYNLVA